MTTTRPELLGSFGMVASTHWLGSAVGMNVLERGGTAADAAASVGFVLQVVEPHLNGPGGEVPILLWSKADGRPVCICGQGVSAAASTVEHLHGLGLDVMPGTGLLPAVVPGAFGAWMLLVERYGRMRVRDILEPAIYYAEHGYPLLPRAAAALRTMEHLFRTEWTSSAETWLTPGGSPGPGDRFRNPLLATTYRRVLDEAEAAGPDRERQLRAARDCWYRGFVAETIADFFAGTEAMDTSGRRHSGLLTVDDLAGWQPTIENPVTFDYLGYQVCKPGPWSQGPVFPQQLALLTGYDLSAVGVGSPDWVHLIVECGKLAFADREAWYGDPRFTDVPVDDLLSPGYADQRRALVGAVASLDLVPGHPAGRTPVLPRYPVGEASPDGSAEPEIASTGETRGDTCHVDVVDRDGMMVSATPSGGWLQSAPAVARLGFCVSTRGQMFHAQDGLPNSLRPRARPRTTLSPSLVLRDGLPWLAFGTPGGDFQDQCSLHFFLNVVHGGMNLQQAIDQPDFHSTHMPDSFYPHDAHPGEVIVEHSFPRDVLDELRRRGHRPRVGGQSRMCAVGIDGGWFRAGASPRYEQAYAVGR